MTKCGTRQGIRQWYRAALLTGTVLVAGLAATGTQATPFQVSQAFARVQPSTTAPSRTLPQSSGLASLDRVLPLAPRGQNASWPGGQGYGAPQGRFQQTFFGKLFSFFKGGKKKGGGGSTRRDEAPQNGGGGNDNGGGNNGGQSGSFATLAPHVPQAGSWRLVPGTAFNNFRLSNSQADFFGVRGGAGSSSVLNHWNGSAYDPLGHFWYFWGGGKGAYGGNEVYRIDLESLRIERITTPSTLDSNIQDGSGISCAVPTQEPSAGSTYDGIVWSPDTQTIIAYPTDRYCPGGNLNLTTAWEFDPVTFAWTQIAPAGTVGGRILAEYDPSRRRLVVINGDGSGAVRSVNPVTGQHGTAKSLGVNLSEGSAVLQGQDDELLTITSEGVHSIPLGNLAPAQRLATLPSGMDPKAGGVYESGRGLLVVWEGGKDIRTFDPNSQQWQLHSNGTGPTAQGQGVFSKFIYIEELDVFAGYNHVSEGIWLYRLPVGAGGSNGTFSAPVADAGSDRSVGKNQTVTLDGRGSSDPDGDPISYLWQITAKPSGSSASLSSSSASRPNFVADREGTFTIRLTVNDGVLTDQDTVQVVAANRAPVADAGSNQSATVGNSVSLNGGGSSDPDGDSITYAWSFSSKPSGSSATISSANSRNASFTPDVAGSFDVRLVVNDGTVQSAADLMTVTATAQPSGPPPNPGNPGDLTALSQHLPAGGKWKLVPGTAFSSWRDSQGKLIRVSQPEADALAINGSFPGSAYGSQGSESVLNVWTGAAYDPVRHRMYFHGGGHNAYWGNEVYELNLENISLTRLSQPAPLTARTPNGQPFPAYGPQVQHTYDGMVWSPATQSIFFFANGAQSYDGENRAAEFNPATKTWTLFGGWNQHTYTYPYSAYDPASGNIVVLGGRHESRMQIINPVTKTRVGSESGTLGWLDTGNAHVLNGKLWFTAGEASPKIHTLTIDGSATLATVANFPSGLDYQAGWDIRNNQLVFWGAQKDIFVFDIATSTWTTHRPSTGPTNLFGGSQRVYSKWVYVSELDAFAGYNNPNEGLWLYCMPTGCNPQTVANPPPAPAPGGSADFATRCAGSAVIYCNGFDTTASLGANDISGTVGYFHSGSGDCGSLVCPVIESGSMKFTIPSLSDANSAGQWFVNFANLDRAVFPGESVFVQWRQKFSSSFVNTVFSGGGGWKQGMIGAPDEYSCASNEIVIQNTKHRGFPQMYHACGFYTNFYKLDPLGVGSETEFDLQPGGPNMCLYTKQPDPNCFEYVANEWMTFQVGIDYAASGPSRIRLWVSREGQSPELVIDDNMDLVDTPSGYGKVWFTPYNTGKNAGASNPVAYTWYDELIISRSRVPDPS